MEVIDQGERTIYWELAGVAPGSCHMNVTNDALQTANRCSRRKSWRKELKNLHT